MPSLFLNFLVGGLSGMCATCFTQPVDMVKVRIQLRGEAGGSTSPFDVAKEIYGQRGLRGFYAGLDSALLRQAVYCSIRIGLYYAIDDWYTASHDGKKMNTFLKSINSLAAGAIGSGIANPCDLALIRMQSDLTLPKEQRRNYKNVFHAFKTILREEGFFGMYIGCFPTIARAMAMNLSMLVTYEECKQVLTRMIGPGKLTIFGSTFISGVFVSVCVLPFDNMKTKLQKQTPDKDGKLMYKNLRECFSKTLKREGFFGYWTGLPTFYFRVAPHAMLTLMFAEFYKKLFGMTK